MEIETGGRPHNVESEKVEIMKMLSEVEPCEPNCERAHIPKKSVIRLSIMMYKYKACGIISVR